jgi:hypothetical protein
LLLLCYYRPVCPWEVIAASPTGGVAGCT